MKKLMLVAVMAFGTMTAFAQEAETTTEEAATEMAAAQNDFAEIGITELPTVVAEAVAKNYPTSTINKAYVNEAKQYKLEVSLGDGTTGTLYLDAEGTWLEL